MEKQVVIIKSVREGYDFDQIRRTMTVGELIAQLKQFDEDLPVYMSHDDGYIFGGVRETDIDDFTYEIEDE